MADTSIRPVQPKDAMLARQLILDGLEEKWGQLDLSRNRDLDDILSSYQDGLFLVAYSASDLIGTGALIQEGEATGRIVRMWVKSGRRRQGTGTAMLEHLLVAAQQRGYAKLVLETEPDWIDAVTFYRQRGFGQIGIKDGNLHFEMQLPDALSE